MFSTPLTKWPRACGRMWSAPSEPGRYRSTSHGSSWLFTSRGWKGTLTSSNKYEIAACRMHRADCKSCVHVYDRSGSCSIVTRSASKAIAGGSGYNAMESCSLILEYAFCNLQFPNDQSLDDAWPSASPESHPGRVGYIWLRS